MSNLSNVYTIDELYEIAYRGSYTDSERQLAKELLAYRDAAKNPVVIVEESDYLTVAQMTGKEPRRKAVRELYEGALVVGSKLYAAPQLPAVPDERAEFESFMSERFGDSINIRRAKNGDEGYMEWDVAVAWIVWQQRATLKSPSFREIDNSSTKQFREIAETSTKCPKCSGRGSYHCLQANGSVDCECTLPAAPKPGVK